MQGVQPAQHVLTKGGFIKLEDGNKTANPKIRKYHIYFNNEDDDGENSPQQKAYQAIVEARDKKGRVPLFPMDFDLFQQAVEYKPYLIRVGNALTLSETSTNPPDTPPEFVDSKMSLCIFTRPFKCPRGHTLEYEHAERWIHARRTCPGGRQPHPVTLDQLQEDHPLKNRIGAWQARRAAQSAAQIEQNTAQNQTLADIEQRINRLEAENAELRPQLQRSILQNRITELENAKRDRINAGASLEKKLHVAKNTGIALVQTSGFARSKVVYNAVMKAVSNTPAYEEAVSKAFEIAWKEALKSGKIEQVAMEIGMAEGMKAGKLIAEKSAQKASESIMQYIGGVSLIMGLASGGYRFYYAKDNSDYVKAVGEVVAGGLACFPGLGTTISVMINIAIAADDLDLIRGPGQQTISIQIDASDIDGAYQILGLEPGNPGPTRAEVDHAYKNGSLAAHPDGIGNPNGPKKAATNLNPLQTLVNQSKETIYKHRGWV